MWQIIHQALRYYPHIVLKMMSEHMAAANLEIEYVWEGDLLCLWNDLRGPTAGFDITTQTILTAFHSREGKRECRGFDFYDAAKMLLPFLREETYPHPELIEGELCQGELSASYSRESDTLKIVSNRHTPVVSHFIADGLSAHCTERGRAVGFTLERAAECLLPHLETWRPWTADEMAQIQKQMAEHDAAMQERMVRGS